jgi:hypothetical protein
LREKSLVIGPLSEQGRTDRTASSQRYRGTEEEKFMQVSFKTAVVALTLAGSSLLMAGCVVAPGPGGGEAAFGYSDGYWDRGHNWHGWNNPQAAASFRAANGSHYYDRRHDQDNNQGWHDNDRYWQH